MLKHKFNKPHLNLHHQFPKIQNKPQKQLAFPKKKKKKSLLPTQRPKQVAIRSEEKGAVAMKI